MSAELLALAERALERAGRGSLQATVVRERSLLARFSGSRPTQATATDALEVELTCVRDGHVASVTTNALDDEALLRAGRRAAEAAEAAARRGPGDYPGLPSPAPARADGGWDEETARLDPARAGHALRAVFAVAERHAMQAAGTWSAGAVERAVASSTGVRAMGRLTDASLRVLCGNAQARTGFGAQAAVALDSFEPSQVAERAAAKVLAGAPRPLPPGECSVVLAPEAVAELLEWLGHLAFNGLSHAEGRGALCGRLGSRVAAPLVNLADSPRHRRTLPRPIDAEGVPKAPLPLIQDGVAHRVVHDTRSAALAGARSTGHALAPGGAPSGPLPRNLVLGGGGARSEEELCAGVTRGLYVTRLWYVNAVVERETLLTGMSRDGTFLIEDGAITHPLHDVRFTDSALRILANTSDLTARARLVVADELYGRRDAYGTVCPALRAEGFRVTGSAPA